MVGGFSSSHDTIYLPSPHRLCNVLMTPLPPHRQLVGSQFSIVPPFFPFWRRLASLHSLRPPLPSPESDKSWLSLSTVAWHLTS